MIYLVGLTYAELTTAMPKCGGEQNFSYAAFGPVGSYICTWGKQSSKNRILYI